MWLPKKVSLRTTGVTHVAAVLGLFHMLAYLTSSESTKALLAVGPRCGINCKRSWAQECWAEQHGNNAHEMDLGA